MGLLIAIGLFGVLAGLVVHNRIGAAGSAFAAALIVWYAGPRVEPMLVGTIDGRKILALLHEAGVGHVSIWLLCGAAFAGVLLAWMLFGRQAEHRPDWEWDPDHPKYRKRLRRRLARG